MKSTTISKFHSIIFNLFLILIITVELNGQQNWQEHLSHDRRSEYRGHLMIKNQLHLVKFQMFKPGTVERIEGNQQTETIYTFRTYDYQKVKTTCTGINEKEVLLLSPVDYDILGTGAVSLRNDENSFRGIKLSANSPTGVIYSYDAVLSPNASSLPAIIQKSPSALFKFSADLSLSGNTSPSPVDYFHEGINNKIYSIKDGNFGYYVNYTHVPIFDIPNHTSNTQLYNDPYRKQLIIQNGRRLEFYTYENFSLIATEVVDEVPYFIKAEENGILYLNDTEENLSIHFLTKSKSEPTGVIAIYPKSEFIDMEILDFEKIDQDIYLIFEYKNPSNANYIYTQKRNLLQPFDPQRQDLEIESLMIRQLQSNNSQYLYEYKIQVINNGEENINAFSITSNFGPLIGDGYWTAIIDNTYHLDLAPGESFTYQDTSKAYQSFDQITAYISGVNFGFDHNTMNDTITVDIAPLSNENPTVINLSIYPNPSYDILNIKGNIDNQSSMLIYDRSGQIVNFNRLATDKLDISQLPIGVYNLVVNKGVNSQSLPFTKI